jgi:hypothetical protein
LQATPQAAIATLLEAEAELILVSRNPDARRAADVVGVVTLPALARLLKTDEEAILPDPRRARRGVMASAEDPRRTLPRSLLASISDEQPATSGPGFDGDSYCTARRIVN